MEQERSGTELVRKKTDVTFDVNAYITSQKSFKKKLSTTENDRFVN